MSSSLMYRVLSALVAILLTIGSAYFFGTTGLLGVGFICSLIAAYEYSTLIYQSQNSPMRLQVLFVIFSFMILIMNLGRPEWTLGIFSVSLTLFCLFNLLFQRDQKDFDHLSINLSYGLLGLIYCGLFPSFALQTLYLENGGAWFAFLLSSVFTGDTAAYFGGKLFGRAKLAENISPKKTVWGSVFGLVGSMLAGLVIWMLFFRGLHPMWSLLLLSSIAGAIAQTGDLFESLLKRVARKKDSGKIMPGHGGILDRLDGLLFASPIVYFGARLLQRLL